MMKSIKLCIVLTALFSIQSCVTDLFDKEELHPPKVSIEKVESNEFNESILYMTVLEENDKSVDFVGVSIKSNSPPSTRSGQKLFQGITGDLSLNLGLLSPDSLYYIKAFSGNESGYAESDIFQFIPETYKPVNAPCTLNSNSIDENGVVASTSGSIASNNSGGGNGSYGIQTNYFGLTGSRTLAFSFQSKPRSGRFLTTSFDNFDQFSSDVYVHFLGTQGTFSPGQYIYISISTSNIVTVEFCDLKYLLFGNTYTLNGSFSTRI